MELNLKGKRALVTGGSSGLGKAAAMSLAMEGCHVVIASTSQESLRDAADEIKARSGSSVHFCAADIRRKEQINALLTFSQQIFGSVDIAVISTGHPPTDHFLNATDDDWAEGLSLIVSPIVHVCRTVIPPMRAQRFGRVIIVGSIFGVEHEESSVIQSTFRRGIIGLMKCLARDNAIHNITANAVSAGYFDTPLLQRHARLYADRKNRDVSDVLEDWKSFSPSKRFGTADEFGSLIAFLSSPLSGFINGSNVIADGAATRSA